jgi:hypothetical protein
MFHHFAVAAGAATGGSTTASFSPIAGSLGYIYYTDAIWATAHDAATGSGTGGQGWARVKARATTNFWQFFRAALVFDTSAIPDGATIDAARLTLVMISKTDAFTSSVGVVASTLATDTALVAGDYDQFGTTDLATQRTIASLSATGAEVFTLNAAGLAAINKTGNTRLAIRISDDISDAEPTWSSNATSQIRYEDDTGTVPALAIDYTY